jgi:hypothetical protein
LKDFYSSYIFQTNSHVPMIYYEPYYIKNLIFSTPNYIVVFKYGKLSTCYACCGMC